MQKSLTYCRARKQWLVWRERRDGVICLRSCGEERRAMEARRIMQGLVGKGKESGFYSKIKKLLKGLSWGVILYDLDFKKISLLDFPGGPVWLRLHVSMQGVWVWSLVGELRSNMLCGMAKKKRKGHSVLFWGGKLRSQCSATEGQKRWWLEEGLGIENRDK